MKLFSKEDAKKYSRGTLIKKIDAKRVKKIEIIDLNAVDRINKRVLESKKSYDSQKDSNGDDVFKY